MLSHGTAGLYFLPPHTTINGPRSIEMLEQKLDLHMHVHECNIFMHDGALCHKSKVVCEFLIKHKIQVFEWPGN